MSESEGYIAARLKLRSFLTLPKDWDSYGGIPLQRQAHVAAESFLDALAAKSLREPLLVPTSRGGVQFEWHWGNVDIEVCFDSDGTVEVVDF